jgi:hypothetical protein
VKAVSDNVFLDAGLSAPKAMSRTLKVEIASALQAFAAHKTWDTREAAKAFGLSGTEWKSIRNFQLTEVDLARLLEAVHAVTPRWNVRGAAGERLVDVRIDFEPTASANAVVALFQQHTPRIQVSSGAISQVPTPAPLVAGPPRLANAG